MDVDPYQGGGRFHVAYNLNPHLAGSKLGLLVILMDIIVVEAGSNVTGRVKELGMYCNTCARLSH